MGLVISGVQTGTSAGGKRDEHVELFNCGDVAFSLGGCKLVYLDQYTYRNLGGGVPAWSYYLLANAGGSNAGQADDLFWISFSRENAGSVSITCGGSVVERVSWNALGGYNFARLDYDTYRVTVAPIPARNSGVSEPP